MADSFPLAQLLAEVQQTRAEAGLNPGPFHPIVFLDESETIATALRKLHAHKILSAPVNFQARKRGILDIGDIAAAIGNASSMGIDEKTLTSMTLKDLYARLPLRDVITLSIKMPVLEGITALSTGSHRILLTNPDDDDHPVGLLSQMDILRFVVRHWDQVPLSIRTAVVAEKVMTRNPHTVLHNTLVKTAIGILVKENVSGIGVVDDQGALVANFSIGDLRRASLEELPSLLSETVVSFLQKSTGHVAPRGLLNKQLVTFNGDTTLEEAAKQMLHSHVHRLFMLDESGKPIGLLSTTDVCTFLAKNLGKKQ